MPNIIMNKLNQRQLRFIDEYLLDLNATQAAIRSGYSKKTAYSIGQENLKKPEIKQIIDTELTNLHNTQRNRLLMAAESAIIALTEIIEKGTGIARVQAANSILDRVGHKAIDKFHCAIETTAKSNMNYSDARQELLEKLCQKFPDIYPRNK
ncbi:MAG: hypothetical protein A3E85_04175 [Gammaproteobacteria bacterium RIFCSPHIGHO2_12_FULL_45_12]|nr:MAG: hypothetical protein A3E85_04175 [Gammaproteobacteria bacterium RIFCSPHIGHO2_12_FULL_45_12]